MFGDRKAVSNKVGNFWTVKIVALSHALQIRANWRETIKRWVASGQFDRLWSHSLSITSRFVQGVGLSYCICLEHM